MGRARKEPYNVVITDEIKKKFFSCIKKGPRMTNALLRCRGFCQDWTGPIATCGRKGNRRGGLKINGRYELAYRISWRINRGPIPPGIIILHLCQREICVRPSHLYAGSESQNGAERVLSGRVARGTMFPQSVLTPARVRHIDKMVIENVPFSVIGRTFNVSRQAAWSAATRRTWRHVKAA